MKRVFLGIIALTIILGFNNFAFAEKLTIIYTGETHASLYPCHCPIEPFGGVSRRATKIKALRKEFSNLLLIDSGGFFAGGTQDETGQVKELEKKRTEVYLTTLKAMGYDALVIGDDEFNFGKEFLAAQIRNSKIPFLSCNLKLNKVREFLIKEIKGIKVGIVGASPFLVNLKPGVQIDDPEISIKQAINKLKKQKVNLIVVLSHLGEDKDKELIKNIKGIDFLISGHIVTGQDKFTKIDDTILLRPVWQARKLGKLEIDFKDKKINNFNVDWLSLGADIPDDAEVKALLPKCFSDYDCVKPDFKGACHNPGTKDANCTFQEIKKLALLVIKPKECHTCYTDVALNNIRKYLPNIEVKFQDYEDATAKQLIDNLKISMLPAYILTQPQEVEKDINFPQLKNILEKKDNYYCFKPYFTGVSYFVGRDFKKNNLDLFILLSAKQTTAVLEIVKSFQNKMAQKINLKIHFLIIKDKLEGFRSPGGLAEIEEAKRSVCVMKYFTNRPWDYLICRSQDIQSTWWDKCLAGIDTNKIKSCATSAEADNLLRENIRLTEELQVSDTPIVLLNNQEVFGLTSKTTVEELEKIVNK